jgi:membrane protease YdiL (CAAX protease family)
MFAINLCLDLVLPDGNNTFKQMLATSLEVRVAVAIVAIITAPFVEELIYRGALYSGLRKKMSATWSVVLITLLFAGVHFPQYWGAWATITGITLLSLALTIVRACTKSLAPCFLIHLIFNTLGAISILLTKWD